MLKLAHLKFPAVGNEATNFFELAPLANCDVTVSRADGWFKRTFIELTANDTTSQLYIGNVYQQLRAAGRA